MGIIELLVLVLGVVVAMAVATVAVLLIHRTRVTRREHVLRPL